MASSMSWEEARDRLKTFRDDQTRNSEEVVQIWEQVLNDFSYKLGDDLWLIYEQVCIAALDCGRIEISKECIGALTNQFPSSQRVKKLHGLQLESVEKYDDAVKIYNSILEADETNSVIRKRLISIYKAQNKISAAIQELNTYLTQYMSDQEGWLELCDLYLSEMDYSKAAFCLEESLMSNPHSHLFHQKYAEIKYTQGGYENMELARSYFSQALKINPNNMRALYGLFMAASNIASHPKSNAKVKKDNLKYAAWAADQISKRYKGKLTSNHSSQLKTVEGMLDTLQITQS